MSEYEKSQFDEGYDRGFNAGAESAESTGSAYELRNRYHYLKLGGTWDRVPLSDNGEQYLAGFEDAMKTLGVKP